MNRTVAAVMMVVGLPVASAAQPPKWTEQVQLGKPIFVTTHAGDRVDGVAGQVTVEGLVISTPVGIRTVTYREMRHAQKRDALWTGAAIGAAVGAGLGIAVIANSDCGSSQQCGAEEGGVVIGGALYGALIGWGLDALVKGKTTLFQSEGTTSVSVVPRRGGLAARATFTW